MHLPMLCALASTAAAAVLPTPPTLTLALTRNTFWLSAPATQVCYNLPPQADAPTKALVYATTGGVVEYTQGLPAGASGCVGLSIPHNASMRIEPHTLSVMGSGNSAAASTAAFNVSWATMVASHRTNPTNVSITVIGTFGNRAERRVGDRMRIVQLDGTVAGECMCYPSGSIPATQSMAKCAFEIPRRPGSATRGPYTMQFYSDKDTQPAGVSNPKPTQTAAWASLGL